jgi:MFS family permease
MAPSAATRLLLLALGAMFLQQSFASMGRNLPPIIAPAILDDLRLEAEWIGVYVAIASLSSLVFQLGCGSFILRHGALRVSQAALVMLAIGLAVPVAGPLALFAISAVFAGGGSAVSTPASSHILGRYSPPKQAPLVFSLKQTAVPAGLLAAGLLGPWIVHEWGWRAALLAAAVASLLFAFALQPVRATFDGDRDPARAFRLGDFAATLRVAVQGAELRRLSLASFAFNGLQTVFVSYFVAYAVALGHGLAAAGFVFSLATLIAVPGRVFWGWVGSTHATPRALMGALSLAMAASAALMGAAGATGSLVLLGLVATGLSLTALSWHGVLLSEAARLAPPGLAGTATGGVLSFGQLGALALPLVYALVLKLTDSHGLGFLLTGLPAVAVGALLLRR